MNKENLEKIAKVFRITLGCLILFWVLLTNFCVFSRYILKMSFAWSDEVFTLMFNWFIFVGAALASIDDKHITITLLRDSLKGKANHILGIIQNILFMVFIGLVCYQSWTIVALQAKTKQITSILNLPVYYTTLAMSIGTCMWLIVVIYKTILEFKALKEEN